MYKICGEGEIADVRGAVAVAGKQDGHLVFWQAARMRRLFFRVSPR